ncbi:MAG: imidazole glycerol phosphate synthase subunit HisF [bacterium]
MSLRIIAKLDVKPPYVIKPVHFEGWRKMGFPGDLAGKYYAQGADEIIYIDIVASLFQREILYSHIETASKSLFIPLGVGGGVRSIDDFSRLFHSGADKVMLNTFAVQEDANIIRAAAEVFGSQSVVVNVEAKKWEKNWECYTDCGRIQSNKDVLTWVKEVEALGAGEIMIQSVDQDGRQNGFDVELITKVIEQVNIPVIAASGAGTLAHILEVAKVAKPDAIAIASILHYNKTTIGEIKQFLLDNDIKVSI